MEGLVAAGLGITLFLPFWIDYMIYHLEERAVFTKGWWILGWVFSMGLAVGVWAESATLYPTWWNGLYAPLPVIAFIAVIVHLACVCITLAGKDSDDEDEDDEPEEAQSHLRSA